MIIHLNDYDMALSRLFAKQSALTQQHREFGEKTTPRSDGETARDTLIGKMAEVAVANLIHDQFGLCAPVNFHVYPLNEADDNDLSLKGWQFDIKATRWGNWLLVEKSKTDKRVAQGTMADVIIFCRTPWNRETDEPTDNSVEIVGCITKGALMASRVIHAGEFIPGTHAILTADNYAVPCKDLYDTVDSVDILRRNPK